ncbi:MAG TPA: hypothetical protein VFE47_06985 [Tepidisphaeraceae bacterium]|jgi:ABC-type Co2+ transport system permease subunit|nr:hypothetical protein [Tepidisphaeraceae bacterium]
MTWRYFIAACLLVALALLSVGAPPAAIAAGLIAAGILNLVKRRKQSI